MVDTVAAGVKADRDAIHQEIWDARDRRGLVKIHQGDFARHLGLSGPHLCRIMKEFEGSGRIKKVGSRYRNVGIYSVMDPEKFNSTGLETP